MNIRHLHSISPISIEDIYETNGSSPIRVLCSDFNFYVCKYHRSNIGSFSSALFNEYLSASFLKLWDLNVPDFAFVKIKKDHITPEIHLPYHYFETICFGSLFNRNYKEVDRFSHNIQSSQKKRMAQNIDDFLKIALFDIWISNEDRNFNNYNLLINPEDFSFVPIDHVNAFNTGNLDKGVYSISQEDSLLFSPLTTKLFSSHKLSDQKTISEMENYFYICTTKCEKNINEIVESIPVDWCVNKEQIKKLLLDNLFTKNWKNECLNLFKIYIQYALNRTKYANNL